MEQKFLLFQLTCLLSRGKQIYQDCLWLLPSGDDSRHLGIHDFLVLFFSFYFENGNGVFFSIKEMLVTCKQRGTKEEKKIYIYLQGS